MTAPSTPTAHRSLSLVQIMSRWPQPVAVVHESRSSCAVQSLAPTLAQMSCASLNRALLVHDHPSDVSSLSPQTEQAFAGAFHPVIAVSEQHLTS